MDRARRRDRLIDRLTDDDASRYAGWPGERHAGAAVPETRSEGSSAHRILLRPAEQDATSW